MLIIIVEIVIKIVIMIILFTIFKKMDNNFKFKTRHVSVVQRSSSVVNSFTSSVELIPAMAYKLRRDAINVQF